MKLISIVVKLIRSILSNNFCLTYNFYRKKEKSMNYKSVFLDIDGTILKPDHTFTNSTKNAIHQMRTKGIEVFLATGRPLHELEELANQLDVHSFIGYNGAYAIHNDKSFFNEPIHKVIVKQYIKISE